MHKVHCGTDLPHTVSWLHGVEIYYS